jgi:hypothetical protein
MFDIDMQRCPNCGAGPFKIIAAVLGRPVRGKIKPCLLKDIERRYLNASAAPCGRRYGCSLPFTFDRSQQPSALCAPSNRRHPCTQAHCAALLSTDQAPPVKTLVVYFSRTGQTQRVANEIARRCDAHLEGIRLQRQGASWFAGWRYNWQTLTHAEPPICRPTRNPANYDLVVLGIPTTRTGLAPPIRSYVRQYGDRIRHMALFCAEGTGIDAQGFSEVSALYGKRPVATFGVARKHLPAIAHREQLIDFVESIRAEPPAN